ncbi:MAG: S8 family serine peptidase [Sedimentisphaerales bacterium]|nr:S8 family serine peptidase [Sedimentisphaerales bacterium]
MKRVSALLMVSLYIWMTGHDIQKVYALAESITTEGSNARALHDLGETGAGVNVGLISRANTRVTHEAFKDANEVTHAFAYDFTGDGTTNDSHDTGMAGIVASRGGASYPEDIGVAPGADIYSAKVVKYDPGPPEEYTISSSYLIDALEELIINQNCRVIVTGIQLNALADGESIWTLIYDYFAYAYDVVFANAAGNTDGVISEITIFGDAYNGITTGGLRLSDPGNQYVYGCVGSLSLSGPTADGRRKPDITAPSEAQTVPSAASDSSWTTVGTSGGQTSYSGPQTAGVAALLLGYADGTVDSDDGQNEVIKAVIVNSAFPNINDKNDNPTEPAQPGHVWHTDRGYGRIDALRAYQTLSAGRINEGDTVSGETGWAYEVMTQNYQEDHFYINGLKDCRLVLTATWDRQINRVGSVFTPESEPAFNLDMTILDSLSTELYSETDTLNNLEKVDFVLPADDVYEIRLTNSTTKKNRAYGLAYELRPRLTADIDFNYRVDIDDFSFISRYWLMSVGDIDVDIVSDGQVDTLDLFEFTTNWLAVDSRYF